MGFQKNMSKKFKIFPKLVRRKKCGTIAWHRTCPIIKQRIRSMLLFSFFSGAIALVVRKHSPKLSFLLLWNLLFRDRVDLFGVSANKNTCRRQFVFVIICMQRTLHIALKCASLSLQNDTKGARPPINYLLVYMFSE